MATNVRISLACAALISAALLAGASCKKSGGVDLNTPINPSNPPAGLDTAQRTLRDGAGNTGPVKVRLQTVRPSLGETVVGTPGNPTSGGCNQSSPWSCFEYSLEICIDPIANPNNLIALSNMRFDTSFSADGTNRIVRELLGLGEGGTLAPGNCTTTTTPVNMKHTFPTEGTPRYFMVLAKYGATLDLAVNSEACPTPEEITVARTPASSIQCAFRTAYDLGYHF